MADNQIVIRVTSENDTRSGFDAAKRDAADAGDQAGQGFATSFIDRMLAGLSGASKGGGFGGGLASGVQGLIGLGPLAGPALGAGVVGLGALLTEVTSLVTGFAAAGVGAAAFGALAHGTITTVTGDYSALTAAQTALADAQAKQAADPTKTNAAAVTTAQLNLKLAQQTFSQDAGNLAGPIQAVATAWNQVTTAFQPEAMKIFGDVLKPLPGLIQALLPMATAFANALDPLLQRFDRFAQSKAFSDFLAQFTKDIGPATTAIGTGIGKLFDEFAQLFKIMSPHDVVHAINIAFDTIAGILIGIRYVIEGTMRVWDLLSSDVKTAWNAIRGATEDGWKHVVGAFKAAPGLIAQALSGLAGILYNIGRDAMTGLLHGLESVPVIGGIASIAGDLIGHAKSALGVHSPSTVFREIGQNVTEGFRLGLQDHAAGLSIGAVGVSGIAGAAGTGGWIEARLQLAPSGNAAMDAFMQGAKLWIRTHGGGNRPDGVQRALGQV